MGCWAFHCFWAMIDSFAACARSRRLAHCKHSRQFHMAFLFSTWHARLQCCELNAWYSLSFFFWQYSIWPCMMTSQVQREEKSMTWELLCLFVPKVLWQLFAKILPSMGSLTRFPGMPFGKRPQIFWKTQVCQCMALFFNQQRQQLWTIQRSRSPLSTSCHCWLALLAKVVHSLTTCCKPTRGHLHLPQGLGGVWPTQMKCVLVTCSILPPGSLGAFTCPFWKWADF